jgi:hypothetical protein
VNSQAQYFRQDFYFEDLGFQKEGGYVGWSGHLGYRSGEIGSISNHDSLAYIKLTGPSACDNIYYALKYRFQTDTLFLWEIAKPITLSKATEYFTDAKRKQSDSLYVNFQEYFEGTAAWTSYDSLTFEVDGVHYTNKGLFQENSLCDSYCNYVIRPNLSDFDIVLWNGQTRLDSYSISVPQHCHSVRLTREVLESRGTSFLCDSTQLPIPEKMEINGKLYVLILELIPTVSIPLYLEFETNAE